MYVYNYLRVIRHVQNLISLAETETTCTPKPQSHSSSSQLYLCAFRPQRQWSWKSTNLHTKINLSLSILRRPATLSGNQGTWTLRCRHGYKRHMNHNTKLLANSYLPYLSVNRWSIGIALSDNNTILQKYLTLLSPKDSSRAHACVSVFVKDLFIAGVLSVSWWLMFSWRFFV